MNRRTFLTSTAAVTAGLAGCLGGGSGSGSGPTDENPDDGLPPAAAIESTPDSRDVDTSSFETLSVGSVEVPLVPIDVAHYWFQRREARFVDARGEGQYDQSHVTGAVLSTARNPEDWGQGRDGPTAEWSGEEPVVCYCGCPHHLSSLRAGEFLDAGREQAYAIDEGYRAWLDNGYPTAGSESNQASYVISGQTDATDAGEYAWASHEASDQQEAGPIGDDGSYEMTLHFTDVDASTPINVRTPSYELTAPIADLTASVVRGPTE